MSVHEQLPGSGDQPYQLCVPEFQRQGEFEMNTPWELRIQALTLGSSEKDIQDISVPAEPRHIGSNGAPRVDMRLPFIDGMQAQAIAHGTGLQGEPGHALFARFASLVDTSIDPGQRTLPMALYESPDSGLPACNVATVHQLADAYASRPRNVDNRLPLSEDEMLISIAKWLPLPNLPRTNRTRFAAYRMHNGSWTAHIGQRHFWELSEKLGYAPAQSPRLYDRLFSAVCEQVQVDRSEGYSRGGRFNQFDMRQKGIPLAMITRTVDLLPPLQEPSIGAAPQTRQFRFAEKYHLVRYVTKMRPYVQGAPAVHG